MGTASAALQQPWDKWPDETDLAYSYLQKYLELGPERSLTKVVQKANKKKHYKTQLGKWSSKHNWVARAGEYDRHVLKKNLKNREEILDQLSTKILSKAEDLIDELIDMAMHPGTEFGGEGTINLYSQKLKAIESALDRIGFVKQKDQPDLDEPVTINNYIQNVYNRISKLKSEGIDDE